MEYLIPLPNTWEPDGGIFVRHYQNMVADYNAKLMNNRHVITIQHLDPCDELTRVGVHPDKSSIVANNAKDEVQSINLFLLQDTIGIKTDKAQNEQLQNSHCNAKQKDDEYCCEQCGKTFTTRFNFARHMRVQHPDGDEPFKCDYCSKTFDTNLVLIEHKRTEHKMGNAYICDECGESFGVRTYLLRHILKKHSHVGSRISSIAALTPYAPYTCDGCQNSFHKRGSLKNHQKVCLKFVKDETLGSSSNKHKDSLMCSVGADKESLACSDDTLNKMLQCSDGCDRKPLCSEAAGKIESTARSEEVLEEEKSVCDGIVEDKGTFTCDICGNTFKSHGNLKRHVKIHSGEMPFRCLYCNRSFAAQYRLKYHEATHDKTKRHVCEMCGKSYTRNCDLNRHKLKHI